MNEPKDDLGLWAHMESFVGEIEAGWSRTPDGREAPFQVVRFASTTLDGTAFATLGLSRIPLKDPQRDRSYKLELVMLAPKDLQDGPVPALLQQIGLECVESGRALLRGDVIGPRGPLFRRSSLEALYATLPVFLPDEFAQFGGTAIVWLVPILPSEASYIRTHGWPSFEDILLARNPDLLDFERAPLTHG